MYVPRESWLAIVTYTALGLVQFALIKSLWTQRALQRRMRTDHSKTIEALRESEAKNKAILSALPDMMFLLDEDGTYLEWHARESNNLYVPPEQFLGKNMRDVMPPELAEVFIEKFKTVLLSNELASVEYTLPIGHKSKVFETRIVRCGIGRVLCIVRDLTDKKQTEQELLRLSSRLLTLQDEERRRIARELHDVTSQNLFAITINLESLRQQLVRLPSAQMNVLIECQHLCEQSLQEVRTLCYALHPPALDKHGLMPSLQWYVNVLGKRSGIDITLQAAPDINRLPVEMETDMFRIVQEGLSNIVRHSGGDVASISLRQRADRLVLQIKDNGRGLPDNVAKSEKDTRSGVGLLSMRERLRRWGGHLHIRSGSDGVLLSAHVPIPFRDQREDNEQSTKIQFD